MAKKVITEIVEAVEVDPAEAKRLRKAAKAAAQAAEAAEVEVEPTEEELAQAKRKRKEAKKAAAEEAVEEAAAEPTEEELAEAKRKRKEAKKAAKAEAAPAEAVEEEAEDAPPKKKSKKEKLDAAEVTAEASTKETATSDDSANGNLRLFVGGIAWVVDEETLRKDFSECGEIADLKLVMDRETGKSKGIAFITMADKVGYAAALKFDGTDYAGRKLSVDKSTSEGKGSGKGKDGKGKGKGKAPSEKPVGCTSVVVKGMSYDVASDDLQKCFQNCANGPTNIKLFTDRATGKSLGMAFVDFDDEAAIDEAMKLSGTNLKGREFYMDYAKPRS